MKHAEAFTSVIGRTQLMKFHSDKLRNKSCRNVLTLHRIMGNRGASRLQSVLFVSLFPIYISARGIFSDKRRWGNLIDDFKLSDTFRGENFLRTRFENVPLELLSMIGPIRMSKRKRAEFSSDAKYQFSWSYCTLNFPEVSELVPGKNCSFQTHYYI